MQRYKASHIKKPILQIFLLLMAVALHPAAMAQSAVDVKYLDSSGYRFVLDKSVYHITSAGENDSAVMNFKNWNSLTKKTFINLGIPKGKVWLKFQFANSDTTAHIFLLCVASHILKKMELFTAITDAWYLWAKQELITRFPVGHILSHFLFTP